jgi:hypothetical protein
MNRAGIGLALAAAATILVFGVVIAWPRSDPEVRLVSMDESAQAMRQAGEIMQRHGQEMLASGTASGNTDLSRRGLHWLDDGSRLVQMGTWMAMTPTNPASLVMAPQELSAQGSWGSLSRTAAAMLHDPDETRDMDLEALEWAGLAMRAEGRRMESHGRVMLEDVDRMAAEHHPDLATTREMRAAGQTMIDVGARLAANGQAMLDEVAGRRRSLGYD